MEITESQMLSIFEKSRSIIIESLFSFVKNSVNKTINLNENSYKIKVDDNASIFKEYYQKLSIENDILLVHYISGKGVTPSEYEKHIDDIVLFSLDEIYCIIKNLPVVHFK